MPGSTRTDSLVLDVLEWIGDEPRPYVEVLGWEEGNDRGFIKRHGSIGNRPLVSVSAGDAHYLRTQRRRSP